jgi:hypothetical protein
VRWKFGVRRHPEGPDSAADGVQAPVIFALYGCSAVAVDGRPAPGGVVAEHAVRIEAPDASPGRHAYLLHLVTSVLPLAAELATLSDAIELARDASIEVGHASPGSTTVLRGRVQLDYSSRLRPRSTGTVTLRSDGVETSGPGAYLRFDPTVRVVR